ncbi:hypothetical protein KPH14_002689 [Odynerus spinipes]|uniref:Reverse transcriptase domain-containing protein n=1 Tax=Odynerus spinipes TaxID=1348599 RepID=A0AAD9RG52_9HYME|nr:hypothetical protein KPH14_002689 [Odynerus spinipes]
MKSYDFPNCMTDGVTTIDHDCDIANLFAKHFSSVYKPKSDFILNSNSDTVSNSAFSIGGISTSISDIFSKLQSHDCNAGSGDDGILPILLKESCFILSRPLWIIFNRSLAEGIFPEVWKSSLVIPIYKSGSRSDVRNYRPISKISSIPKVFESIIVDKIRPVITNMIVDEQHGFVNGRSTVSNLALFTHHVASAMECNNQVDVIDTDFSKAFDTVDHRILIQKLENFGFYGQLLSWLSTYLTDRYQSVKVHRYNIFINDIVSEFANCKVLLYADDLKVFRVIKCLNYCLNLQSDLLRFESWCIKNKMSLNTSKCHLMQFSQSMSPLCLSYSLFGVNLFDISLITDLGVTFDSRLNFKNRYMKIANKILYCTLVRSQLEFASVV